MNIKILILFIMFNLTCNAQVTRYFEFSSNESNYTNWRDTTFIASVSNQVVIDSVLANLARPFEERKFISGPITLGNGGVNKNASHWFLWHFIPDQWNLSEMSPTICQGLPYTMVDTNVNYWVNTIGMYCPTSYRPVREVSNPLLGSTNPENQMDLIIYPVPTNDYLYFEWNENMDKIKLSIVNTLGQVIMTSNLNKQNNIVNVSQLSNGVYYARLESEDNKVTVKKMIIER